MISNKRMASNHHKKLVAIAEQIRAMAENWDEVDQYFMSIISDCIHDVEDAATKLRAYVDDKEAD